MNVRFGHAVQMNNRVAFSAKRELDHFPLPPQPKLESTTRGTIWVVCQWVKMSLRLIREGRAQQRQEKLMALKADQ